MLYASSRVHIGAPRLLKPRTIEPGPPLEVEISWKLRFAGLRFSQLRGSIALDAQPALQEGRLLHAIVLKLRGSCLC